MLKVIALITVLTISTETSATCAAQNRNLESENLISCNGDLTSDTAVFSYHATKDETLTISRQVNIREPNCRRYSNTFTIEKF